MNNKQKIYKQLARLYKLEFETRQSLIIPNDTGLDKEVEKTIMDASIYHHQIQELMLNKELHILTYAIYMIDSARVTEEEFNADSLFKDKIDLPLLEVEEILYSLNNSITRIAMSADRYKRLNEAEAPFKLINNELNLMSHISKIICWDYLILRKNLQYMYK